MPLTPARPQVAFVGNDIASPNSAATFASANRAYLYAVTVYAPCVITGIRVTIGVSSGNLDVGIYDSTGNRLASSGSTASPGTGNQTINFTASASLVPGTYYLAVAADNNTVTITRAGTDAPAAAYYFDTSFPLPSTVTLPGTAAGTTARLFVLIGIVTGGISI